MAELMISTMESSIIKIDDQWIFVRHTPISSSRPTIVLIHALGDSSLSFLEAFESSSLKDFNLIAPDLVGHGCTPEASDDDYSFGAQIKRINKILDELPIAEFFLVGHSLGADIATRFAATHKDRVSGLVNIEGNLTPADVVISKQATAAADTENFERWFREDFMKKVVLNNWGAKWASCQRYYASLWFCSPQAFLSSAREVCQRNSAMFSTAESETGWMFQQVDVPKVYCWGGGMSDETAKLIEGRMIQQWGFKDAFHWPMIDKDKDFYRLLGEFCSEA
jgi:pimeloyl-ACP methyl ester carboxylesterase